MLGRLWGWYAAGFPLSLLLFLYLVALPAMLGALLLSGVVAR